MDFTREPIIETIITPKEGHKIVVRSSKSTGQEEYFVDAVEVVAFGHALFFRSMERPKAFLVPVSDYEILEVREARMVLKNAGLDRSIKIGGGKEANFKPNRDEEKREAPPEEIKEREEERIAEEAVVEGRPEGRLDKKRDRRRNYRKKRGRDEEGKGINEESTPSISSEEIATTSLEETDDGKEVPPSTMTPAQLSSLLQPPPMLISETINRYRQNDLFKGAFYLTEEEQYKPHEKVDELLNEEDEDDVSNLLQEPTFDSEPETALHVEDSVPSNGEVVSENAHIELPIYAQEEDRSMEGGFFHSQEPTHEIIEDVSAGESHEEPKEP